MEAYFGTGSSDWIGKLGGELENYQVLFEIARPVLCEKDQFSLTHINNLLHEVPELVRTENDVKIWGGCFRNTIAKLRKTLFCKEEYQTLVIEMSKTYCPTLTCKSSWIWNRIEERGQRIAADLRYCEEFSSRSKRQFDSASFLDIMETMVCGSEFNAVMKELEKMTGGHIAKGATIWADMVCCLKDGKWN